MTNVSLVAVDVPVMHDGKVLYGLSMALPTGAVVQRLAEQLPAGEGWAMAVLDSRARIVAHIPQHERFVGRPGTSTAQAFIRSGAREAVVHSPGVAQVPALVALVRISDTPWVVAVGRHESIYLKAFAAGAWTVAVAIAAVLVLGLAVAVRQARRLQGAVRTLEQAARRVDAGATLPVAAERFTGVRELSAVAQALSDTANRLALRAAERDAAEAQLRRSEQQRQLALTAARMGTWTRSFATDEATWDPAEAALVGLPSPGEAPQSAQAFLSRIHPEDRGAVEAAHARLLRDGGRAHCEFRYLHPDGRPRWIATHMAALHDASGRVTHYTGVDVDITEQKQAPQALGAAKEAAERAAAELERRVLERTRELDAARTTAERANHAKDEFLAHMGHEIRTPLTGVLASADLLLAGRLEPEQASRLQAMRASARVLRDLLNDLLDFARIEAGWLELRPSDFQPAQLLEEVAMLFSAIAAGKGTELRVDAQDLPAWWTGDHGRIRQVLVNLVGNAVKFTDAGSVAIEARPSATPGALRLTVRDTGIGLSEDIKPRLFDAFAQGREASAGQYGGSGLGLAICKRLVDAMGGTISADGAPGQGAAFTVEIPVAPRPHAPLAAAAADGPAEASAPHATLPPLRLLIAEDNPLNRELLAAMLRLKGHRVEAVGDGALAVQAIEAQEPFDAVLMDVRMLRVGGLEAARRIRALDDAKAGVPIVAVSADALELRQLADAGPFDRVIEKPVDWDALQQALAEVLGQRGAGCRGPCAQDRRPTTREPAAAGPALMDVARFEQMRALLGDTTGRGPDTEIETGLREATSRVRQAVLASDPAATRQAAHALAGLAANLGCAALAALARRLQHEPGGASVELLDEQLAATLRALAQIGVDPTRA